MVVKIKDKNLYYECSLEQICDFNFITEIINIFKDESSLYAVILPFE